MPQVQDVISIIGFSQLDQYNARNEALMVAHLSLSKTARGPESAQALINRVNDVTAQQVRTALVQPFKLPPVTGLSTIGGFEYELENLQGADPPR